MTIVGSVSSSESSHRPNFNRNNSSNVSVLDEQDFEQRHSSDFADEKAWNATCAKCYDCRELIPYKLLYVCRYKRCYGFFEEKTTIYRTPFEFYEVEKVFCSKCSFVGNHKYHQSSMEEAHSLATTLISKDDELQQEFKRLAFLDHENPVDYAITNEFLVKKLPVLAAADYLLSAQDSEDWEERRKTLDELKKTVEQCRLDGTKFVKQQAEKALSFYKEFNTTVEKTFEIDLKMKNKDEDISRIRADSFPTPTYASSSTRDDVKPVLKNFPIETDSVVVVTTVPMKKEEPESPPSAGSSVSISTTKSRADDSTARMICRNLSLHFNQIRDDLLIENALQDVSDKLHHCAGSIENKLAAARLFKEKNNVALYYPLQ